MVAKEKKSGSSLKKKNQGQISTNLAREWPRIKPGQRTNIPLIALVNSSIYLLLFLLHSAQGNPDYKKIGVKSTLWSFAWFKAIDFLNNIYVAEAQPACKSLPFLVLRQGGAESTTLFRLLSEPNMSLNCILMPGTRIEALFRFSGHS